MFVEEIDQSEVEAVDKIEEKRWRIRPSMETVFVTKYEEYMGINASQ
jgi:hypothetical protein